MKEFFEKYPPLLSVNEVAEILDVTPNTVRRYIHSNLICAVRVGKLLRIPKDSLINVFERCQQS